MVRAQWIRERATRRAKERRRKWPRRSLGPARIARFEVPRTLAVVYWCILRLWSGQSNIRFPAPVVSPCSCLDDDPYWRDRFKADSKRRVALSQHACYPATSSNSSTPRAGSDIPNCRLEIAAGIHTRELKRQSRYFFQGSSTSGLAGSGASRYGSFGIR